MNKLTEGFASLTFLRGVGGPIRGDIGPAVGGQWSPRGRLSWQIARTGSGREKSAEHKGDGHQAPTEAQTPQHHHFQVRRIYHANLQYIRPSDGIKRSKLPTFEMVSLFLLYFDAFRGICTQAPCYCIIMEYCAQGQLYEVLRAGRKITPSLLMDWAMGIAGGMNYLHLHKIIHRDLKSPK